jgi:hypothetical protein
MFKFLRKYNKLMLAVFGVLLMITFLIPQAFNNAQDQGAGGATVASIGEDDVFTSAERERAQRELRFIEKLGFGFPGIGPLRSPEHWYLLVREADQAGLIGTPGSAGIDDANMVQLVAMTNESPDFIRSSVAKVNGVGSLFNLYQTGGLYSDRRLMRAAEELMHQATVQMVVLQADKEQGGAEPTEQQIQDHFSKHRDADSAAGGFGYKLPDRVKIEWIKVPVESIREVVRNGEQFNGVAQRKHWRRYATDQTKNFPPPQDTGPVPDVVKNDLLEELTRKQADSIANDAVSRLSMNRRGLPEAEGYAVLPQDWQTRKLSFQALAQDLQARHHIALPEYHSSGDQWTPLDKVNTLEGLGKASSDRFGNMPIRFDQLVQATKEFNRPRTVVPIQKDIAGPSLTGSDGSVYVFRIIDTDAARSPNSVDEVRDQVIADLKRQAHYDQLAQQGSHLEQEAETKGLMALALEHDAPIQRAQVALTDQFSLQQRMQYNLPLSSEPSPLPVIGRSRSTSEAIIKYVLNLPQDKIADELPEEQRTWVVPAPDKLAVLVVRLMQSVPLTQERFVQMAQQSMIQNLVGMEENLDTDAVKDAFSYEALAKRHNFKMLHGEDETPADPNAQASAVK